MAHKVVTLLKSAHSRYGAPSVVLMVLNFLYLVQLFSKQRKRKRLVADARHTFTVDRRLVVCYKARL